METRTGAKPSRSWARTCKSANLADLPLFDEGVRSEWESSAPSGLVPEPARLTGVPPRNSFNFRPDEPLDQGWQIIVQPGLEQGTEHFSHQVLERPRVLHQH